MPKLRVVEGKLSSKYNHFKDYRFDSCIATDTRLMGVGSNESLMDCKGWKQR